MIQTIDSMLAGLAEKANSSEAAIRDLKRGIAKRLQALGLLSPAGSFKTILPAGPNGYVAVVISGSWVDDDSDCDWRFEADVFERIQEEHDCDDDCETGCPGWHKASRKIADASPQQILAAIYGELIEKSRRLAGIREALRQVEQGLPDGETLATERNRLEDRIRKNRWMVPALAAAVEAALSGTAETVPESVYRSAVEGRRQFRQMYREERAKRLAAEGVDGE